MTFTYFMTVEYIYISGVLAWRRLLWNTKPSFRFSTTNFNAYYKKGDFSNALADFLFVVPNARKSKNLEGLVSLIIIHMPKQLLNFIIQIVLLIYVYVK